MNQDLAFHASFLVAWQTTVEVKLTGARWNEPDINFMLAANVDRLEVRRDDTTIIGADHFDHNSLKEAAANHIMRLCTDILKFQNIGLATRELQVAGHEVMIVKIDINSGCLEVDPIIKTDLMVV